MSNLYNVQNLSIAMLCNVMYLSLSCFGDESPHEGCGWEDDSLVRSDHDVLSPAPGQAPSLYPDLGPGDPVQHHGQVDTHTSEYSVLKLREQTHEEANKARN